MTYKGTVKNGVVVLPPDAKIPDGTEVRIEPVQAADDLERLRNDLLSLAGTLTGLPSDMAENHDHYAHGAPKR
jgi:hypothetical protein